METMRYSGSCTQPKGIRLNISICTIIHDHELSLHKGKKVIQVQALSSPIVTELIPWNLP